MSDAAFAPLVLAARSMGATGRPPLARLGVRDFDAPPPAPAPLPDPAALAAEAEAALAARLQAAHAEGYAAGEAAGRRRMDEALAEAEDAALARIAAALEAGLETARGAATEAAEALARLLLAALDAALPAAAARLAPESAAGLATILLPLLREGMSVTLAVAPGCGAEAATRIGDARLVVEEDAALPPGDARASWRGGGAVLSLAERRAAVAETLAALGLQEA